MNVRKLIAALQEHPPQTPILTMDSAEDWNAPTEIEPDTMHAASDGRYFHHYSGGYCYGCDMDFPMTFVVKV